MKNLSRLFLAPTLAAVLLGFASPPLNAARRVGGSAFDGTWSVAIYTMRGNCSSVRVAVRIVGGRVYSEDQSYRASGGVGRNGLVRVAVSVLAGPQRAPAGCRAIPAQEVGGHPGENAPAVGRPPAAQAITESGRQSRRGPVKLSMAACSQVATFPFDQVREVFQERCHANLHLAWSVHVRRHQRYAG
jgi:hypothetical protein